MYMYVHIVSGKLSSTDNIMLLLYLSVSTHAMIGQFSRPYSTVQLKFKAAKIYGPRALCLGYKSMGKKLGL